MITLHRLNGKEFVLNADHIKFVEATPDTIITLTTDDEKFMVKESVDQVINKTIDYRKQWFLQGPMKKESQS